MQQLQQQSKHVSEPPKVYFDLCRELYTTMQRSTLCHDSKLLLLSTHIVACTSVTNLVCLHMCRMLVLHSVLRAWSCYVFTNRQVHCMTQGDSPFPTADLKHCYWLLFHVAKPGTPVSKVATAPVMR
jgi:hypothetical protein